MANTLYALYQTIIIPERNYYSWMISFKGDSKAAHFGELPPEQFDEAYETKLKVLIFHTKESIKKGEFCFDNSDEKACGYCDMKFICHE